ncbi:short chain dehydrogenase [Mollisia scopiformis]|uniref:Short chain dehydrogenase n=1 Tax=Mollisia scopiformis TaxID=149040 RepID=A0A194WU71_MOLSC|nr:short chain dehydrogenase [Mollisia scopiformis]KUJ11503.1 short chain dehydrogenase [Mollisia scopiformis]
MTTTNKTIVLVTGANQGIGLETVKKLAKEQPSYHILLGSRNPKSGSEAAAKLNAENVEPITIDVTSDESIAAAAALVEKKFGRLDVLINNAGIAIDHKYQPGPGSSIREVMRENYDVNVFGAMQVFETFVPLLEKAEVPRAVFVTSILGSFGEMMVEDEYPIYRSTKSALNMVVRVYAARYREKGWKINVTCPGLVRTNLNGYTEHGESVEVGAINAVRLATAGKDGETGTYSNRHGPIPW